MSISPSARFESTENPVPPSMRSAMDSARREGTSKKPIPSNGSILNKIMCRGAGEESANLGRVIVSRESSSKLNSICRKSDSRVPTPRTIDALWDLKRFNSVDLTNADLGYNPTCCLQACRWQCPRGAPRFYSQLQSRRDCTGGQQQFHFPAHRKPSCCTWIDGCGV